MGASSFQAHRRLSPRDLLGATAVAAACAATGCDFLSGVAGGTGGNPTLLDPCYGPDTPDGQPGAPPIKASQDPGILSAGLCSKGSCGAVSWPTNFNLPVPAAADGWIVQEILYNVDVTGPGATPVQNHYWEAFWFPAGSRGNICGNVNGASDDLFNQPASPNGTKGTATWIGKAKFYEGTLPGDFARAADRLNSPTGALRFTRTQPSFWDGTGTDHDLTVVWDCTDPGNPIGSVQIVPPDDTCFKSQ